MQKYALIMAGGGGIRFWPLSRQHLPKQLLNITGNDVMINETIKRIDGLVPCSNICIITNRGQAGAINKLVTKDIPGENILFEPVSRNTAACIAYGALVMSMRCEDAVMCVLPSDHYIANESRFRQTLDKACRVAEHTGKLVTIGIKPVFPATGYGYLRCSTDNINGVLEVEQFVEKPALEKAKEFFEDDRYLWNSGMFAWRISTIIDNIRRYIPRLYKMIMKLKEYIGTDQEVQVLEAIYPELQNISIDFGIMERSDEVVAVAGDFGWNDIGSWDALGSIFPTDENGNIVRSKHIGLNTRNTIIYGSDRLIATIGLEGLIIADTPDALMICPKSKSQEVKELVEKIKKQGLDEYI